MSPPTDRPPHGRKLTASDRKIWDKVTRTVTPKAKPLKGETRPDREKFADMMRVTSEKPTPPARPGPLEVTAHKSVRRGRVRIDSRIDLHDNVLADALPALERGLIRSYNRGETCVLVITGKGRRLEGRIRAALPGWLAGPTLRPIVATYSQAHIRHGGSGAWYVFLKKAG